MLFGMLRGDRCVVVYVHGPQGQVLGAFGLKTIQKINCKEINVKIKKESRIGEAIIVQNCNLASYLQNCYIITSSSSSSPSPERNQMPYQPQDGNVQSNSLICIIQQPQILHPLQFAPRTHEKTQLNVTPIMK